MKIPNWTWETEYKHDRRKHRHRCKHCRRIINAGEKVLMARITRGTVSMHIECADIVLTVVRDDEIGMTNRDKMYQWSRQALKNCGWDIPELRTNFDKYR